MARTLISLVTKTTVTTTTVDTLFGIEGGAVRFFSNDANGTDMGDGHLVLAGGSIIFPPGLAVKALAQSRSAATNVTLSISGFNNQRDNFDRAEQSAAVTQFRW